MDEERVSMTSVNNDKTTNEKHQSQNNVLNSKLCQEHSFLSDTNEMLLKTSSRPQRQAAKKAENQIRVSKWI